MSRICLKRAFLCTVIIFVGTLGAGAATVPSVPILKSPGNGAMGQSILEGLSWSTDAAATSYEVQVSTVSGFGSTLLD